MADGFEENAAFLARVDSLPADEIARWKYQRYIKDYMRAVLALDRSVSRVLDALDPEGVPETSEYFTPEMRGQEVAIDDVAENPHLNGSTAPKKAWPHDWVVGELQGGRGSSFDKDCVDACLEIITSGEEWIEWAEA